MQLKFRYFLLCLIVIVVCGFLGVVFEAILLTTRNSQEEKLPFKILNDDDFTGTKSRRDCRFHSCFNHFKCRVEVNWDVKVFVYPEVTYLNQAKEQIFPDTTKEFQEIIQAVKKSRFWTNNPARACIFIPHFDFLSEKAVLTGSAGKALASLQHWDDGENHIIFNFFQKKTSSANPLTVNIGKAVVASGSFNQGNFRPKFDIVIPVLNSFLNIDDIHSEIANMDFSAERKWLLAVPYGLVTKSLKTELDDIVNRHRESILQLSYCRHSDLQRHTQERCMSNTVHKYPDILKQSAFCLILPSSGLWKTFLTDALMQGCIPVVLQENLMPFSFVLDWKRVSVSFNINQVKDLINLLRKIDKYQLAIYRRQSIFLWQKYFSSLGKVVLTTLEILNERISPHRAKSYSEWNGELKIYQKGQFFEGSYPPLYIPLAPSKKQGFTAVILTYNRKEMLYHLIKHLENCPSLVKVLVVWNNPNLETPAKSEVPGISKQLVFIKGKKNKLSNRFFPYKEIETEAILSIDDDISMLTVDELEFGYQVWRAYPDRLVGFPGRNHKESDSGQSKTLIYESEWANDVSMVLTGVAFYHKVYNHMFTYKMPRDIISFVDQRMNCEDIAMNFLVANLTRKAVIKVTPRKRFICPKCGSNESLWSETSHFTKRSECLKKFMDLFGGKIPLERVDFRADPVLFKDDVPLEVQEFPDIGSV